MSIIRTLTFACTLCIPLAVVETAYGQNAREAVDSTLTLEGALDLLTVPGTPAFTVLGREPSAVERPTVISDFSVIVRQVAQSESALPVEVGVEFNPYLLLTGSRALSMKEVRSPEWYKTISLSFGTISDTVGSTDFASTILGAGVKVSPFAGSYRDEDLEQLRGLLRKQLEVYRDFLDRWGQRGEVGNLRDRLSELEAQDSPDMQEMNDVLQQYALLQTNLIHHLTLVEQVPAEDAEAVSAKLFELIDAEDDSDEARRLFAIGIDSLRAYGERILSSKLKRSGFTLDLAGGVSWAFARGDADSSSLHMAGGWVTTGYEGVWNMGGVSLSTLLLGRYLTGRTRIHDQDNIDFGGRLLLDTESPFSMSVEAVHRWWSREIERADGVTLSRDGQTWRVVGSATYQVGTRKAVSLNFGRSFDDPAGRDLVASLSLSVLFNDAEGIELTPDLLR